MINTFIYTLGINFIVDILLYLILVNVHSFIKQQFMRNRNFSFWYF